MQVHGSSAGGRDAGLFAIGRRSLQKIVSQKGFCLKIL
jgi:hypothetical protein